MVGSAPQEARGRGSGLSCLQMGCHAEERRYLLQGGGLKGAGGENQCSEGPPSLPRWGGEAEGGCLPCNGDTRNGVGGSLSPGNPKLHPGHHPWALLWAVRNPRACPGELSGGRQQRAKGDTGHSSGLKTAAGGWSRRSCKVSSSHCFVSPHFLEGCYHLLTKPGSSSTPSLHKPQMPRPSPFPNHQHLHHSAAAEELGEDLGKPSSGHGPLAIPVGEHSRGTFRLPCWIRHPKVLINNPKGGLPLTVVDKG